MADFEAGQAWISLQPSARNFQKNAKKELAAIDLDKSVDLDADKSKVEAAIKDVRDQLKQLDRERVNPAVDFDIAVAEAKAEELRDKLAELKKGKVDPKVDVQIERAEAQIEKLTAKLADLGKKEATPKVEAEIAKTQALLDKASARLDELNDKKANPKVDAVGVATTERDLARVLKTLAALNEEKAKPGVEAQIAASEARLQELLGLLGEIDRRKAEPQVLADTSQAKQRLAEVQSLLQRLSGASATPEVELQIARAQQEALRIEAELARLGAMRPSPEVDAEIGALSAKLAVANQELGKIDAARVAPEVTADTSQAQAQLSELDGLLRRVDLSTATPQVQLQVAQAQQEALRIRAELERLGAMAPSPQVDADIASATAKLALVNQQLRSLGDKTVHVNASGNAGLILSGIAAALGAIMAVAPAAAAALAGVAGAAGAVGQGVAAGLAGFSGIGDALKALEQDEKSAATSSAASSNTRAAAAKQVESAQRQLAAAQQNASRAAITGAQQVADAERSLQQASVAASRARIQASQQVAAAQRAVSDAITSANARVASAERSLESAQRSRQYAQERLTDAVRDATRAQRDLNLQVSGAALSEERATLSLAQARERLAKSTSADPLERADLALSVREAEQNLKEVQNRYGDLKSDQADWARGGVAGSRQVRDATRGVEDAQRGVQDAARGVTEAQVSGARQVADAQQALAQAQQQAAWSVQDAQRGVADAQLAVGRASQQAAWAQQDAAQQVADAQRALADAYTQGGEAAAAGGKQAEYALSKLTPAGRSLVTFLDKEWAPSWKRVTDSVADAMLPKVETALRNLLALEPVVKAGLTETGNVLGDLAVKGAQLATSAPFQANFASIMASNNRALRSYGDAGLNLFGAFTDLYAAAGPVTEEFARNAAASSDAFETWVIGARASGDLDRWLQQAADTLEYLGGWLVDVGGDVVGFASSLAPLGGVVLEVVRGITDWVSWLAQLNPQLTSTVAGAALAATAVSKLGTAMSGMAIVQGASGIRGFANVIGTVLNPAALYNSGVMTKMRDGIDRAGIVAGGYTEKVTGSARASTLAAGGAQAFSRAATGLTSALPLLTVAFTAAVLANDAMTASTDEAVDALSKGGYAAQAMREKVASQSIAVDENSTNWTKARHEVSEWLNRVGGFQTTTDQMNAALEEQRRSFTDLQNAQWDAGVAQGDYDQKVRDFGRNSPQAVAAQGALADATNRVTVEQDKARTATMNATQALQDQQNKILASIDARLALRQSTQQVADAQKAYSDAVKNSGAGSDEANAAQLRLEQSQTNQAAAARRAAEEEAKRKGVVDASALANTAYAQSIGDMVAKSQGQLTPALTEMIQSLDYTGLSAAGAKVHIDDAGNAVATFPNGKTVTLDANTSPALQGFAGVALQLSQVPNGKTITLNAMTEPEKQKLLDLGFTVNTLPDGRVEVTANDAMARGTLLAFQQYADWQQAHPDLAADPAKSYEAMRGFLDNAGRQTGVPMLDANPQRADEQVRGAVDRYNRTWSHMPVGAATGEGDRKVDGLHDRANNPETMPLDVDTSRAESNWTRWIRSLHLPDWLASLLGGNGAVAAGGGLVQKAMGGLVEAYAAGGSVGDLQHKQVIRGFPAGGRVRGPGTATSDSIPAMLSNGEYVIRASAVQAIGVPALHAINAMAAGGVVGFAAGGSAKPAASGAAAGSAPAVSVPAGDAGAASDAAGATAGLAGAMDTATNAAGALDPALAAVTAQQQSMVAGGVSPLASALTSQLVPAVAAGNTQIGVQAPLAHQALQGAQVATQLSTGATAANAAMNNAAVAGTTTAMSLQAQAQHAGLRAGQVATQMSTNLTAANTGMNNAAMSATTTGMSLVAQGQHAGLRAGQAATQASTNLTAANAGANNANMAATTTGMSLASQAQHAGLRAGHGLTQGSNVALAQNTAGNNVNMQQTTGTMSATNQGHLGSLRGAQGVTTGATTAFADSWRDQLGRTVPDSANPLRHVITVPIRGIVDAWNTIDGQFALGKHVPPPAANFATGGVMPGYTPGRDVMTAAVSGGEAIMRPEWTRVVGSQYIDRANAAARGGGLQGVRSFLTSTVSGSPRAEGTAKQNLMRRFPLDDATRRIRSPWAGAFAYGGVAPHVAAAGDAVTRALGPMPGGIGGRGARGNASDHPSGFALDFMTLSNMPLGDRVAGFLQAQAEPLAVKYLIWKQAINGGKGWSPMENRGSPTANHMDHVHASFEGGPMGGAWGDGAAGGSMFDFGAMVRDAFKFVFDLVAGVPKIFGPSDQVARGAGIPRVGADLAINKIIEKLSSMFAGAGGGVPDAALANLIIGVGKGMGFPRKGPEVALATAFQESGLRNINYGDRDSLGVFQQRPSMGWGTPAQIMDPRYSAMRFYNALRGVRGWEGMPHTVAAQRVQRSAFPDAYAKWVGKAIALVNQSGIYDNGGLLQPGRTLVENNTGFPERVLTNVETRSYDTLTRLVGKNGVKVDVAAWDNRPAGPAVHIDTVQTAPGETATGMAKAITWQVRTAKRGGVYAS